MKSTLKCVLCGILAASVLFLVAGCSNDQIVQQGTTDTFTQDFNPPFLDVLWMVNNQSPMYYTRDHLIAEASSFFKRLDGATASYRMVFTSADNEIYPDTITPSGAPLDKNSGTVDDRANTFGDLLGQVINLRTSATDEGFQNALTVLQTKFKPRDNVPLVLVMISDADDHSTGAPSGQSAVDYYAAQLLKIKGGNANLLRVYSINYKPLLGATPNSTNRCATEDNADADKPGFQDRYFSLARKFSTDLASPDLATGDLCKSFADNIDISGLRQKELPKAFTLKHTPDPTTISVSVTKSDGTIVDITWTYDATKNQIVFDTTPPEGTSIVVTYHNA